MRLHVAFARIRKNHNHKLKKKVEILFGGLNFFSYLCITIKIDL